MAVTKLYHLDETGVQTLATYLLRCTNSRIKERILTAVNDAAYTDDNHVLSAKAILGNVGKLTDYATMTGEEATVLGKVKAAQNTADAITTKVGNKTDTSAVDTVYGAIAKVAEDAGADIDALEGRMDTAEGDIDALETSVSNINTEIGTSEDASTEATVYGAIKKVDERVDAVNTAIGAKTDATTTDTVYGYVNKEIAAVNATIGEKTDAVTADTVYGYVNKEVADLEEMIGGLTHLTYQEVVGPISSVTDPSETVLYLQRDEDAYRVGNDGYLLNSNGNHATYNGYEAWLDTATGKIYKMTNGVKGEELPANDPIFDEVQKLADNTYNLYIWSKQTDGTHKWVCVGNTSLDLANYWSKKDTDVAELQSLIVGSLSDEVIVAKVKAAWDSTDPYAEASANSFVPADWA